MRTEVYIADFDCTFEQAMEAVCNRALLHCEPAPEPFYVYVFETDADMTLFALEFAGEMPLVENLAVVTLEQRAAADTFLAEYGLIDRVTCYERLAVRFWDTDDELTFRDEIGTPPAQ